MLKDTKSEPAVPAPPSRKMASAARALAQAAALAAVLVPLGSVPAEATSLSCTYTAIGAGAASYSCPTGPEGGALFQFPGTGSTAIPYVVELGFDNVTLPVGDSFFVTIEDIARSQAELEGRLGSFPGSCVEINPENTTNQPCVEFSITHAPEPNDGWQSSGDRGAAPNSIGYFLWVYWQADTNGAAPDPHIIHDTGGTPPDFDVDMTIPGSYLQFPRACAFDPDGCSFIGIGDILLIDGDPAIGGRDNDFTSYTVISPSGVPEPMSLVLLGSGISGLLYRRRQQSPRSGSPNS